MSSVRHAVVTSVTSKTFDEWGHLVVSLRRLGRSLVTVLLGAVAGLAVAGPARAAGLEQVPSFGTCAL